MEAITVRTGAAITTGGVLTGCTAVAVIVAGVIVYRTFIDIFAGISGGSAEAGGTGAGITVKLIFAGCAAIALIVAGIVGTIIFVVTGGAVKLVSI